MTHIHDTTVDVAELLEPEQTGAMSRVIESEALVDSASHPPYTLPEEVYRRSVDGDCSSVRCRVGLVPV